MWWNKRHNIPCHIQLPEGPYIPGCFDVYVEPNEISQTEECFFRIYYPTNLDDVKDHSSQWVRWVIHPMYLMGMARIVRVWIWIVKLVFAVLAGDIHIPAVWAGPPLDNGPLLPVVILSHGMGGSRFFYAGTCIELASRGCVVAAIEHKDQSACITPRCHKSTHDPTMADVKEWIRYTHMPKDGSQHAALRHSQVQTRMKECLSAVAALDQINSGKFLSRVSFPPCLVKFQDRLDLTRLVMMGHSFGAATALLTLGQESRFTAGVILDAWMYPLKEFKETLPKLVKQPLVFINTETFHIDKNLSALKRYTGDHPVYTIRSTTHEHQTDTVHLLGSWLNLGMQKLDPSTASQINNHLIMQFLHDHIGLEGVDERFLLEHADKIISDFVEVVKKPKSWL